MRPRLETMQTAAGLRPINIRNLFLISTLNWLKMIAINKMQFDKLWCFEISNFKFFLGGGAYVVTRPVRQKPRYATDHLIDIRNLFCAWDNIKLLSTAFPTLSPTCRKQFVIEHIQDVPLVTEAGISLIILTPMTILQRNLNRSTFVVWEMKRDVSVVRLEFRCNILSGKIIKEMPGSVASGTHRSTLFLSTPSRVCTGDERAHYDKHPSSHHVFHRIHMRNPILRPKSWQGTRTDPWGCVGGVKVKKLSHGIWRPHRSRYIQSCACPSSQWVTPITRCGVGCKLSKHQWTAWAKKITAANRLSS